jgi:site-specific recombinase XerD
MPVFARSIASNETIVGHQNGGSTATSTCATITGASTQRKEKAMETESCEVGNQRQNTESSAASTRPGRSCGERKVGGHPLAEGREAINCQERGPRDALVSSFEEATRLAAAAVHRKRERELQQEAEAPALSSRRAAQRNSHTRGVFERKPGEWWICYFDASGRKRREKAGTWASARDLYIKRKNDALRGKKLPETLRRKTVPFAEIAKDALAHSKQHKRDYRHDVGRMETLLSWFREYPAESITPQEIERRFEKERWSPATCNRFRALLSLTYRLAILSNKVGNNPARLVKHRREDNTRIRFLSADEEAALRKATVARAREHLPEIELALHTGMRLSEQYGLTWADVSLDRRLLTIPRSKNGLARHVPLNHSATRALESLRKRTGESGFVCGGAPGPRPWFEPVLAAAKLSDFSWHCLRHTFASRLVMAGVDLRTVQELLGHKTIAMTIRYAHLAPKHTLAAVERLDDPETESNDTTTDTTGAPDASAA